MDSHAPLVVTVTAFLVAPALVLVHELGHAAIGLLRTEGLVTVRVGSRPLLRARVGRLVFQLGPWAREDAQAGLTQTYTRLSPRARLAYALAGPAADATVAAAAAVLALQLDESARIAAGAVAAFAGLLALHNLRGSDGRSARAALAEMRAHGTRSGSPGDPSVREFEQTRARFLARVSRAPEQERAERLATGLSRLFAGASVEEARAALRLGWAGWCWRESERAERTRIRAVSGGPGRPVEAAVALVTAGAPLGLASPGESDVQRMDFLERALRALPPSALDLGAARRAFHFGVALRDTESLAGVD